MYFEWFIHCVLIYIYLYIYILNQSLKPFNIEISTNPITTAVACDAGKKQVQRFSSTALGSTCNLGFILYVE